MGFVGCAPSRCLPARVERFKWRPNQILAIDLNHLTRRNSECESGRPCNGKAFCKCSIKGNCFLPGPFSLRMWVCCLRNSFFASQEARHSYATRSHFEHRGQVPADWQMDGLVPQSSKPHSWRGRATFAASIAAGLLFFPLVHFAWMLGLELFAN